MARNPGRVSLYELIGKSRFNSLPDKVIGENDPAEKAGGTEKEKKTANSAVKWPSKPRAVRLYKDRIEFSFSWQLAAVTVLVLIALMLVFYKIGRMQVNNETTKPVNDVKKAEVKTVIPEPAYDRAREKASATSVTAESVRIVEPMGDNVIVIASYELSSHLEAVKEYFRGFGIATEVISSGSRYLLVTQDRFDNPEKAGTDGFEMKKKIIAIGANYRPPKGSGFESFGPKPFHDAYGMKVK